MKNRLAIVALLLVTYGLGKGIAAEVSGARPAGSSAPEPGKIFAKVGDAVITVQEYDAALQTAARQKFYHGKPPEGEVAKLQREVADQLVNRILLLQEARRRAIKPDAEVVRRAISGYDARYAGSPQWQKNREQILPGLTNRLEEQNILQQLEAAARKQPPPDDATLRQYYQSHLDLFTEPVRFKASVILLKVDPASPAAVWGAAREEAKHLLERLGKGADFAGLARLHSADPSAEKGGDLGYVHRGLLGSDVEQALDRLSPGKVVQEPIRVLEGYAIFRLDDRTSSAVRGFEEVKERAAGLWLREREEAAWADFLAQLRKGVRLEIDQSHYLPLAAGRSGDAPQR